MNFRGTGFPPISWPFFQGSLPFLWNGREPWKKGQEIGGNNGGEKNLLEIGAQKICVVLQAAFFLFRIPCKLHAG